MRVQGNGSLSADGLRREVEDCRRKVRRRTKNIHKKIQRHFDLAAALADLHTYEGDDTLDEAIAHTRTALELMAVDGHPELPGFTTNLVLLLAQKAREVDDDEALDEAVGLARELIDGVTESSLDRVLILGNSAAALGQAGLARNDGELLIEGLNAHRRAVRLAGKRSRRRGRALVNVASACRDCHERLGDPAFLRKGIRAGRKALRILRTPDLDRAAALKTTAILLRERSQDTASLADLQRAIGYAEESVELTPAGHPDRAARLSNLAAMVSDDYDERAGRDRLDRAIDLYRDALKIREPVAHRLAERRNNLSLALRQRYADGRNRDDLDEAVQLAEAAESAGGPGTYSWAGHANNLGNALIERYEVDRDPADLDRAATLFEAALAEDGGSVQEYSGYATNLGLVLAEQAKLTGKMAVLDRALTQLARAIDVLVPDDPRRADRLSNLSDTYRQRSIMMDLGGHTEFAIDDAKSAVSTARDAVIAAGESQARLLPALANLAVALRWQRQLAPASVTSTEILGVQGRAACLTEILPMERFRQSVRWAHDAVDLGLHDTAFRAYEQAIGLITEVAWIGLGVAERIELLAEMNKTAAAAVAWAVQADELWTAVAWADHTRSVLWRQDLQISGLGGAARNTLLGLSTGDGVLSAALFDGRDEQRERRERARRLAHKEEAALRLSPPEPGDYAAALLPGVVVLLVPDDSLSSALLLRNGQGPERIPLPEASAEHLTEQVSLLREACKSFGNADPWAELAARHKVFDCLAWAWNAVVEPVLAALPDQAGLRPHLWWSPVGDFALLPIHAAGLHPRKPDHVGHRAQTPVLQDVALSSYAPTVLSPYQGRPIRTDTEHLLYVSADSPTKELAFLAPERAASRAALADLPVVELLADDATRAAVREAIMRCSYLHIACHGERVDGDAVGAGFLLADGLFTLGDLASSSTPHGTLAVLLTCDSASGDVQLPNEVLHVAGAAHHAGFPDVVAATLPVRDSSTVTIVEHLYRGLDRTRGLMSSAVPDALHDAVNALRLNPQTGPDPLSWVPYAHFSAGATNYAVRATARLL